MENEFDIRVYITCVDLKPQDGNKFALKIGMSNHNHNIYFVKHRYAKL